MADQANKSIKITFEVDENRLQRVRTLIADVARDIKGLAQSQQNLGNLFGTGKSPANQQQISNIMKSPNALIPGGGPTLGGAGGGMAQGFIEAANAMKGLSNVSRDTMRMMSDAITRSVSDQKRSISDLDNQIEALTKKYTDLGVEAKEALRAGRGGIGGIGLERGGLQGDVAGLVNQRAEAGKKLIETQQAQAALNNTPPPGGGGGGGGGGFGGFGGLAKVGGGIMAGAQIGQSALNELQLQLMSPFNAMASRSNMAQSQMQRLAGGDVGLGYAMYRATTNQINTRGPGQGFQGVGSQPGSADSLAQIGTGAGSLGGWWNAGMGSAGNVLSKIPFAGKLFGSLAGLPEGGGAVLDPLKPGNVQTKLGEASMEMVQKAYEGMDPLVKMGLSNFQSSLGSRQAMQRLGVSGNMGIKDARGNDVIGGSRYNLLEEKLTARGYDMGGYQGALSGLTGMGGGRFAHANADEAMRAAAAGYGGWGGVLFGAQRMGGDAGTLLGLGGGGINKAAATQLGGSIYGGGFDPRGNTTNRGLMSAISSGFNFTGGVGDMNTAARVGLGIEGMDKLTTGAVDPYQSGRNLVAAINANSGGGVYAQDAMAGMNFKNLAEIASGGSTAESRAHGLTAGMAKQQIAEVGRALSDQFIDQPGVNDRMSKTMRSMQAAGGPTEYFKSLSGDARKNAVEDFGVFLKEEKGLSIEEALGTAGLTAGMSGGEIKKLQRGGMGVGLSGPEADMAKMQASTLAEMHQATEGLKDLPKAIAMMKPAFDQLESFGANLGKGAEEFIGGLLALGQALHISADAIQGIKAAGNSIGGTGVPKTPGDSGKGRGGKK